MTLKGRSGGKWGVRDGLAQAYCNRRRRKRRSFAAGSGRRSKTGELARTKSAKRAGLCAAIERYNGGDSAEAFQVVVRGDLVFPNPIPLAGAPHIAIPTTAGTGSEVTRFTVITDPVTNEKMLIAGPTLLPTAAVVDFELTLTMPARLTADTGIDSLTHAIEAYVSRRSNSFSDSVAQLAMRDIWRYLPIAFFTPSDRIAREAMMTAATLAGMAFSNSSVALVHGMSRPIGAHFHVPHGLSNAMLLPVVTRFSAPTVPTRYADCARAMGLASSADSDSIAVDRLLAGLFDLNRDLKVPSPKAYGIDEQKYRNLIPTMALQALASGSPSNNPRIPTAADIEQLYRDVWESPEPYPASSDLARRL